MNLCELSIGTRFDLVLQSKISGDERPILVSQYEWSEDDHHVFIAAPIVEGIIYPIKIGALIDVYFIQKLELYRFEAQVLSRGIKDNISLLKIKINSDFERIQRRQYYRFECSIDVKCRELLESKNDAEKQPYKKTLSKDLSGGGLCIMLEEKLEVGKLYEFKINLGEENEINFIGKVIRSGLSEINEKFKYEHGINFKKIENRDRETLIKFIFNEQRKLRQKGLI